MGSMMSYERVREIEENARRAATPGTGPDARDYHALEERIGILEVLVRQQASEIEALRNG
jgi:hypothetical protein